MNILESDLRRDVHYLAFLLLSPLRRSDSHSMNNDLKQPS